MSLITRLLGMSKSSKSLRIPTWVPAAKLATKKKINQFNINKVSEEVDVKPRLVEMALLKLNNVNLPKEKTIDVMKLDSPEYVTWIMKFFKKDKNRTTTDGKPSFLIRQKNMADVYNYCKYKGVCYADIWKNWK